MPGGSRRLCEKLQPRLRRQRREPEKKWTGAALLESQIAGVDAAKYVGVFTPRERCEGYLAFTKRHPEEAGGFIRLGVVLEDDGDIEGAARAFKTAEDLASRDYPDFKAALRKYLERSRRDR